jgi:Holliday junction resolvase RusA-like endonuclease
LSDPVFITIPGRLRGKGRPRARVVGKFARIHTDAATASAEAVVRQFAALAIRGRPLLEGALKLNVTIWLHRPKSWSKRQRLENPIPTGKPDLDNVCKLVADSLNGIVFHDDSQISELMVKRLFIAESHPEQTEIVIGPLLYLRASAA